MFRRRAATWLVLIAACIFTSAAATVARRSRSAKPAKPAKPTAAKKGKPSPSPKNSSTPLTEEAAVARWMSSLSLREKIAQLVVIPFNGHPFRRSRDESKFINLISHEHVGGVI